MLPRLLAMIALLMIGAGLALPAVCPDTGSCDIPDFGLVDPARFDENSNEGVVNTIFGLLIAAAAAPALVAILTAERGTMYFSAFVVLGTVAINLGYFAISIENLPLTLSYGWAVLGMGGVLLFLSGVLMKPVRIPQSAAVQGPRYTPNKTLIEQVPQLNKTRIEGIPVAPAGGMQRTIIEPAYGQGYGQGQPPYAPPPAQAGSAQQPQPLPQIPGFGDDIDPLQKTMVEGGAAAQDQLNPNLKTAVDLSMRDMSSNMEHEPNAGMADGRTHDTAQAPHPYAAPPQPQPEAQPVRTDKTMVDGIAAPQPDDPDGYEWQRRLEEQREAEETARKLAEAAALQRQREEEAARQAAEASRRAAEAEAQRQAEAARQAAAKEAEAKLDRTNVEPIKGSGTSGSGDIDATNVVPSVKPQNANTAPTSDTANPYDNHPTMAGHVPSSRPSPAAPTPPSMNDDMDDMKTMIDSKPAKNVGLDDDNLKTMIDSPAVRPDDEDDR